MFEATFSNEYGQIWTVNIMAKTWAEAGAFAEKEEGDGWVLMSITRLVW